MTSGSRRDFLKAGGLVLAGARDRAALPVAASCVTRPEIDRDAKRRARFPGLVRSNRAICAAGHDGALDCARKRAHDDRLSSEERSTLAADSRWCSAVGLGLSREARRNLRRHANGSRSLRLLLHAARSGGDGGPDRGGEGNRPGVKAIRLLGRQARNRRLASRPRCCSRSIPERRANSCRARCTSHGREKVKHHASAINLGSRRG